MNGFVIAVGTYIGALTERSKEVANEIGKVSVEIGGTACKVPRAMNIWIELLTREELVRSVKRQDAENE